jgi:hypothetical protein
MESTVGMMNLMNMMKIMKRMRIMGIVNETRQGGYQWQGRSSV